MKKNKNFDLILRTELNKITGGGVSFMQRACNVGAACSVTRRCNISIPYCECSALFNGRCRLR